MKWKREEGNPIAEFVAAGNELTAAAIEALFRQASNQAKIIGHLASSGYVLGSSGEIVRAKELHKLKHDDLKPEDMAAAIIENVRTGLSDEKPHLVTADFGLIPDAKDTDIHITAHSLFVDWIRTLPGIDNIALQPKTLDVYALENRDKPSQTFRFGDGNFTQTVYRYSIPEEERATLNHILPANGTPYHVNYIFEPATKSV